MPATTNAVATRINFRDLLRDSQVEELNIVLAKYGLGFSQDGNKKKATIVDSSGTPFRIRSRELFDDLYIELDDFVIKIYDE